MSESRPTKETNDANRLKKVLELHFATLEGDAQHEDAMLIVRLKWFGEDLATIVERLDKEPESAVGLVKQLSHLMQELDAQAGAADYAHRTLSGARKLALILLPGSTILGESPTEPDDST